MDDCAHDDSPPVGSDPFALSRFLMAQGDGDTYQVALGELRRGRKLTHWMWFVFPQLAGLGRSFTAQRFAITSLEEAQAYLAHPVLGTRLRESAKVMATAPGDSVESILGGIDAQKLQSSMTLFLRADPQSASFKQVLDRWFSGAADGTTDQLLAGQ